MYFPYRLFLIMLLLISSQTVWACLPLTSNAVFIGRVQSAVPVANNNESGRFEWQFSSYRFVFRTLRTWFIYSRTEQWTGDFAPKGIAPNDLVIGLAYDPDGGEPEKYAVSTLAALRCENDVLTIDNPIVPYLGWNRDNGSCRHDNPIVVKGLLDGFIDEDQTYYLQLLQKKYRTCKQLDAAFPINQSIEKIALNDSQEAHKRASTAHQSFWHQITSWFKLWW